MMRRAKLQPATTALIPQLYALEKLSFPEDEAADEAGVFFRCQNANSYFQVLRKEYALHDSFGGDSHDYDSGSEEGDIIGYVNATLDTGTVIKHESMSSHNVDGETLVIHSVTIAPHFRRKGWGSFMLKAYLQLLLPNTQVKRILLLAKAHLLSFYVDCGFKVVRLSPVQHGKDQWFDLMLDLEEMRLPRQYTIDAFTKKHYKGNSAAVVIMPPSVDFNWDIPFMHNVAKENNLPETAFVSAVIPSHDTTAAANNNNTIHNDATGIRGPANIGSGAEVPNGVVGVKRKTGSAQSNSSLDAASDSDAASLHYIAPYDQTVHQKVFRIRWFTPTVEVDLCGHATLAATHALYAQGLVEAGECVLFLTQFKGKLEVSMDSTTSEIKMVFPALPIEHTFYDQSKGVHEMVIDASSNQSSVDNSPRSQQGGSQVEARRSMATPSVSPVDVITSCFCELFHSLRLPPDSILFIGRTIYDIFVEVGAQVNLRDLVPDQDMIKRACRCMGSYRGLIMSQASKRLVTVNNDGDGVDSSHTSSNKRRKGDDQSHGLQLTLPLPPTEADSIGGSVSSGSINSPRFAYWDLQENHDVDFYSRFFGPLVGIEEDPVTGSAHCALGPYYYNKYSTAASNGSKAAKSGGGTLKGMQLHPVRGGYVKVTMLPAFEGPPGSRKTAVGAVGNVEGGAGGEEGARVELAGHAVTTISSKLSVAPRDGAAKE